jgi:hypothetical protein
MSTEPTPNHDPDHDQFEDLVLAAYRQGKQEGQDVANRQNRRILRILIIWFTASAVLALVGVILHIIAATHTDGAPRPQTVTYTITTAEDIHQKPGGTCTSGPSGDTFTVSLWDAAGVQRVAPLSAGRQVEDRCTFTATMPVLRDAQYLAFNGAYHEVPAGVGLVALSADDGDWRPVRSMTGLR